MKRIPPWVTLLLLAPFLGEIVSGHQPPREIVNPLSVLLLMLPYGLGALVCRELVRRWQKGWLSLLLLAVAYAIYEEAIVVRSIFNPDWGELGILKEYSHVVGVTWTYAGMLIHFHVLVSIGASIILAEILYPEERRRRWLSDKGLTACIIGLSLWLPAGLLMTAYVPPLPGYLLSWAALVGLITAARLVPGDLPPGPLRAVPGARYFLLLGFLNMTLFFVVVYVLPGSGMPPLLVSVLALIALDAGTLRLLLRWSGNGRAWDDRHRLAWVAGGLGFFILFGIATDLENFKGSSIVSVITLGALCLLALRITRRLGGIRHDPPPFPE